MNKYEILINKDHLITDEQIPKNLIAVGHNLFPIEGEFSSSVVELENVAAINFMNMINEANKIFENKIIPDSGYRSIERQQEILDFYLQPSERGDEAYHFVALPGASEHHTGLAIDVALIKNGEYTDSITGEEPELKWLFENCCHFGFILRYPKGKEDITGYSFEPWHFRYVGNHAAKIITENNITLEEYHKLLNQKIWNKNLARIYFGFLF